MKTYRDYTLEIANDEDVLQTVNAIESIAASSIHSLKGSVAALDAYTQSIRHAMDRLTGLGAVASAGFLTTPRTGLRALCIIGGDRGMVGNLYHSLINETLLQNPAYDRIVVVGSKIATYLAEEGLPTERALEAFSEHLIPEKISAVTKYFLSGFGKEYKTVDILYPAFVSMTVQEPRIAHFLPFSTVTSDADGGQPLSSPPTGDMPIYEPDASCVLNWLMTRYIEVVFTKFAAESKLSELAARTVASERAATKTKQLIEAKRLEFFREREHWLDQMQLENFSVRSSL